MSSFRPFFPHCFPGSASAEKQLLSWCWYATFSHSFTNGSSSGKASIFPSVSTLCTDCSNKEPSSHFLSAQFPVYTFLRNLCNYGWNKSFLTSPHRSQHPQSILILACRLGAGSSEPYEHRCVPSLSSHRRFGLFHMDAQLLPQHPNVNISSCCVCGSFQTVFFLQWFWSRCTGYPYLPTCDVLHHID